MFIVCPPLCFLLNKVNKTATSLLKTALTDYYDGNVLNSAKHQLLKDTKDLAISVECPHVPERREGPNRTSLIMDDMFTLLSFLNKNLLMDKLPIYVTDNPESLPSLRIYEGDFSVIMAILAKLENRMGAHDSILAAIGADLHRYWLRGCEAPTLASSVCHLCLPAHPLHAAPLLPRSIPPRRLSLLCR